MEKCPCCERELKGYMDFPLLYIHDFKRMEIPKKTKLPFWDSTQYMEAGEMWANPHPPDAVVRYFEKHPKTEVYNYGDSIWELSLASTYGHLRFDRFVKDAKETINKGLDPWFKRLESLVGTEVQPTKIAPYPAEGFEIERDSQNREIKDIKLPGTEYKLSCSDFPEEGPKNKSHRLLGIYVDHKSRRGHRVFNISQNVAYIVYEGRLNKQ